MVGKDDEIRIQRAKHSVAFIAGSGFQTIASLAGYVHGSHGERHVPGLTDPGAKIHPRRRIRTDSMIDMVRRETKVQRAGELLEQVQQHNRV